MSDVDQKIEQAFLYVSPPEEAWEHDIFDSLTAARDEITKLRHALALQDCNLLAELDKRYCPSDNPCTRCRAEREIASLREQNERLRGHWRNETEARTLEVSENLSLRERLDKAENDRDTALRDRDAALRHVVELEKVEARAERLERLLVWIDCEVSPNRVDGGVPNVRRISAKVSAALERVLSARGEEAA